MLRSIKTALVLGLCLSFFATGCIGQFGLSGKVREFNLETTSDRWSREILFVILMVIPIYPFASAADIIIFNSIEFWTGTNPINQKSSVSPVSSRETIEADGTTILMTLLEDQSIDVETLAPNGDRHFMNLIRTEDGIVARDQVGEVLARAPHNNRQFVNRALLPAGI